RFIDLFAGAGGLSLGLMKAGWQGLLAIEQSEMAFETLQFNLIDAHEPPQFAWPRWLPRQAMAAEGVLTKYRRELEGLRGIDLLAGGPPCQGFSEAGKRRVDDERNRLIEVFLEFVDVLRPKLILVENVSGFLIPFKKT